MYLSAFWAAAWFLTALMYPNMLYFELLGCVALFTEALLGLPQLLKNHKAHSTAGLSPLMVWGWAIGDSLKTIYFAVKGEPLQFIAGGTIQTTVDLLIMAQVWLYPRKRQQTEV